MISGNTHIRSNPVHPSNQRRTPRPKSLRLRRVVLRRYPLLKRRVYCKARMTPDPSLLFRVVHTRPRRQKLLNQRRRSHLIPLAVCLTGPLLMPRRRSNLRLLAVHAAPRPTPPAVSRSQLTTLSTTAVAISPGNTTARRAAG